MSTPASLQLSMTEARLREIEREAARRSMTATHFVNAIVKDYLVAVEARTREGHPHCFCKDRNTAGLARCCLCDVFGQVRLSGTRYA